MKAAKKPIPGLPLMAADEICDKLGIGPFQLCARIFRGEVNECWSPQGIRYQIAKEISMETPLPVPPAPKVTGVIFDEELNTPALETRSPSYRAAVPVTVSRGR